MKETKTIYALYALIAFAAIFLTACNTQTPAQSSTQPSIGGNVKTVSSDEINWRDAEFSDVRTGTKFKITDFEGKPILLESFAVWCPTCTKQQKEIKKLHSLIGDDFVSISLDTDPSEDESNIKEHLDRNSFDWLYAVSPVEATQSLISEFGISIVNAPSAPVILVCGDLSARLLKRGLKPAEDLQDEMAKGC